MPGAPRLGTPGYCYWSASRTLGFGHFRVVLDLMVVETVRCAVSSERIAELLRRDAAAPRLYYGNGGLAWPQASPRVEGVS